VYSYLRDVRFVCDEGVELCTSWHLAAVASLPIRATTFSCCASFGSFSFGLIVEGTGNQEPQPENAGTGLALLGVISLLLLASLSRSRRRVVPVNWVSRLEGYRITMTDGAVPSLYLRRTAYVASDA